MATFLIALVMPIFFNVGGLKLSPYRLVLIVMLLPLLARYFRGEGGRIYGTDLAFFAYVFWMGLTLLIHHGTLMISYVGVTTIETLGAFLMARIMIRTPEDFDFYARIMFGIMLVLVPAAVVESTTGIRIFPKIADAIAETHRWVYSNGKTQMRLGMFRAQSVFDHPIHFGVYSASTYGLLHYTLRRNGRGIAGFRRSWISMAGTFFALSSGAIISIAAQLGMSIWDKIARLVGIARHRWKLMIAGFIAAFVVVDLLSNRTPFEVFISYMAFSAHNGYVRIIIFNYGLQNILAHPIFGLGMGYWVRPAWLPPSVDNFWLLMGMRHGIPGFLFVAIAFIGPIIRLGRLQISDPRLQAMRYGIMFSMVGVSMSLVTVHVWGQVYVYLCFLFGAGAWLRDYKEAPAAGEPADEGAGSSARVTSRARGARQTMRSPHTPT